MDEKIKTHGVMNKNDGNTHEVQRSTLLEIAAQLEEAAASASSPTMSKRAMTQSLTERLASSIANYPDVRRSVYVKVLVTTGYYKERNAQKIVKSAYDKSKSIAANRPYTEAAKPKITSSSFMSNFTNREVVNPTQPNPPTKQTPVSVSYLSDYVKLLPETLPRPICAIVRPEERSEAMQINLQRLRNELFLPGTDRFIKQLRYQAPVTSNNPFGLYQLAAPHREKIRYGAIWDAIGNNDIPPLWFPAILPYLAEEGLLEYYKVESDLVAELEQARQTYLSDGVLQAYDRKSTFIPRTKPPHAPDGYVCT
ncbi:hypothetical protein [Acidithiobacillus sp. HP-11]|uniref:hypothetical protein n=1 Tax=Acidithiobacillus sp. HP-11 TaxID=2697656 RepID=UPI00187907AD|nr:hypothetical protein [Acidithiobacillus sp. HP-11]MBE7567668.1 hypothetical protein [Acidithiobacillus sp. HP-11]